MGKSRRLTVIIIAFSLMFIACGGFDSIAQTTGQGEVQKMKITGEIAKMDQGYIIRGKVPLEIFTVLNPGPELDKFVQEGKTFEIEVKVVSGDNVEIKKIDGKEYPPVATPEEKK